MYVYVVIARRWGGDETHNYLVGVYTDYEKALNDAEDEYFHRGGKYELFIEKTKIDHNHRMIENIVEVFNSDFQQRRKDNEEENK